MKNKLIVLSQILFIVICFFILSSNTVFSVADPKCYVLKVDGTIDYGYADFIDRLLDNPPIDVDRLIIILNTNGGYLEATEKIVDELLNSYIHTTVFIPRGGRAFSAGAYISFAAEELIMSPTATIGSAEPRTMTGESDPKIRNAMEVWIRAIAKARGRNDTIATLMVVENLDITGEEAYRYNVANKLLNDINEVLDYYGYSPNDVIYVDKDLRSIILSIITDPMIVGLLIDLAAILIIIEITHPTYIGAMAAALLIILALVGLGLLGVNIAALILLFIGATAIILEIKTAHGGLAAGGAILTIIGILLMYQREYFLWSWDLTSLLIGFSAVLIVGVTLIGFYLHKIREVIMKREKIHDIKRLVGKVGIVKTAIEPRKKGVVLVESDLWTAEADEYIPEGSRVVVESIDGLIIKVKKLEK